MLVLALAGAAALSLMMPIAIAIAVLLVIVITSYRQTVRAYPNGGGSYIVSRENLGTLPGLTAAAAILTDYVLTVAVSVTAGTIAVSSAAPSLEEHRVAIAIGFVGADHARQPPRREGGRHGVRRPDVRLRRDGVPDARGGVRPVPLRVPDGRDGGPRAAGSIKRSASS